MIFFLTKPWDVHHFSCTSQVFLPFLHTSLPQNVLQVLLSQKAHAEHTKNLLPPSLHLTFVEVRKLSRPHPEFHSLKVQEISVEIFKVDALKLAVIPDFRFIFRSTYLLENDCIDVGKYIFVVLVFALAHLFLYFLLFLLSTFSLLALILRWRNRRISFSIVSLL